MRRHGYLLCLVLWIVPMAHGEATEPKTDRHGDPLPEGVVARLGTVRLRHASPVQVIRFAPDGKTVFALGCSGTIRRWDVTTGKQIRSFSAGKDRPGARRAYWFTIGSTPQGGVLLAAPYQKYDAKTAVWGNVVTVWDADTGKLLWELNCPHVGDALISPLVFSRDGKSLAVQQPGHSYTVYDLSSGKEVHKIQSPVADAKASRLSADLTRLATIKGDEVRLWDAATGKEVSRCKGHEKWARAAQFSEDGKVLLTSDAPYTVRLWDVASGKLLHRLKGKPDQYCHAALSPDARRIATLERPGVCRIWDAATGKQLHEHRLTPAGALPMAFSPDGKRLATSEGPVVHIWDIATGKNLHPSDEHGKKVVGVAFSADGKSLASSSADGTVCLWDVKKGKILRRFGPLKYYTPVVVFSADGKTLIGIGRYGKAHVWDTATGKEKKNLDPGDSSRLFALSADGKTLAVGQDWGGESIRLWDVSRCKERRQIPYTHHELYALALGPEAKVMAGLSRNGLLLWDTASGKELCRLQVGNRLIPFGRRHRLLHEPFVLAFSGDGALLALGGPRTSEVQVWEVATGKLVRKLASDKGGTVGVVFSPDGLIMASQGEYGTVSLWDLTSGQEVGQFDSDRSLSARWPSIAFSPDGRTLAVGRPDTTVLLHDLTGMRKTGGGKELTEKEMESLWNDLGDADAGRAYESIGKLAGSAKTGVPFLTRRLQPAEKVAPQQIVKLIADLDADKFEARQRATEKLAKLGEGAEAELRKALAGNPPLEKRRRLEDLLARLEGDPLPPDRLRHLRALRVLETIGTPEARRVVAELAKGTGDTWRKRQAQASLDRLNKRLGSKP